MLEKLKIETEISTAQNTFYAMFCKHFEEFSEKIKAQHKDNARELLLNMLEVGRRLNINMSFYQEKVDVLTGKINY